MNVTACSRISESERLAVKGIVSLSPEPKPRAFVLFVLSTAVHGTLVFVDA